MDYESIKSYFTVKHSTKDSCMAICPCHNDKRASLSINHDEKNGKTLLYCHAGCSTRDILNRVGLKMGDLFLEKRNCGNVSSSERHPANDKIAAVYKYTDRYGNFLFEKIRFHPKQFANRRYVDGCTAWGLDAGVYYETYPGSGQFSMKVRKGALIKEFPGVMPVLYNLPGVYEGVLKDESIFIVEGEKDADSLIKLGLAATTNFDGASKSRDKPKWREEYNDALKGAQVVLIPDNDIPGRTHMAYAAKSLKGIAGGIKMLELPVPNKEDVSFWLAQGHTREELINLVENTMDYSSVAKEEGFSLVNYNFTDVGNAERLIALYGDSVRFNCSEDAFYIWSGKHWQYDATGGIYRMAKSALRHLKAEGEGLDDSKDEKIASLKKSIISFALKSENDSRIKAMVNQCKSQAETIMGEMDTYPFALNVRNGTLDLKGGKLKCHEKSRYITKIINMDFNIEASCPNWINFLDKIFKGNKEIIDYVQKSVGYSLTGSQEEQCFYVLYGDGARGDLAKLVGKRFVIASELNEGQAFDESLLKNLTGDDTVPVRFLYDEEFDLKCQFKLWIGTNEKPRIRGTNLGIWRRVRMIPFLYTFSGNEKDKNFYDKYLAPELQGILSWAVEGCLKWQNEGMEAPQIIKAAVEDYKCEMDAIQKFIDECCIVGENYKARVNEIYDAYCRFCKGSKDMEMPLIKFGKKLKEKGFEQHKGRQGRYWKGLGITGHRG